MPWWVRALSQLPLPVLYGIGSVIAWLAHRVVRYRRYVVEQNLATAFPDRSAAERARYCRDFYRNFAQVLVETLKSVRISRDELLRRVSFQGDTELRKYLREGRSVILVAAHHCNWEWLSLSLTALDSRVSGAYKPIKNPVFDATLLQLRTRFGARLIPAKEYLVEVLKQRKTVQALAILGDQEPPASERCHWSQFLNRDTAFYVGAEEIARLTRWPVFFTAMRRVARGRYTVTFTPLLQADERLEPGELTERFVRHAEAEIHASPPDWTWTIKRWKRKRSVYG
jgi:KDO2-lipid IV(A) lauroyltransferase